MLKVSPSYFQDLEFVRLSNLPYHQAIKLQYWLPETSYIKVALEDGVIDDCINYSEYEYWFEYEMATNHSFSSESII